MKRVYTLLACILMLPKLVWAQYYIELNKDNTFHYKNSYLIDIPISYLKGNIFIQDSKRLIPVDVYSNMYLNEGINQLDTVFISRIPQIGKIGLQKNVLQKNIIPYFLGRYYMKNPTDTLGDADNRFKNYKELQKINRKDSILIYCSEDVGEPCCYSDSIYRTVKKYNLNSFISYFEKKHHLKIGKVYGISGDEGDAEIFLTLSNLNEKQKVQFLNERNNFVPLDKSERTRKKSFKLYAPYWMAINDITPPIVKIDPNQIYIAVEVEPSYPNGLAAFKDLFNTVNFSGITSYVITFVVQKDGSLTDIKVLRGNNNVDIDKEVFKILRRSANWIPGKQNGAPVNVQFTVRLNKVK
jgi:hypothetical protein